MTKTAYFGYSTYAEYKSARLRTAHTKLLRDLWRLSGISVESLFGVKNPSTTMTLV